MNEEATVPAWHDEPICGGMWYGATEREAEPVARFYDDEEAADIRFRGLRREVKSWYGPIPDRPKQPEPLALPRRFRCFHQGVNGVGVAIGGNLFFWWGAFEGTPLQVQLEHLPASLHNLEWLDPEPAP